MNIERNEVLRYLGYSNQQIDTNLDNLINECIAETSRLAKPLSVFKILDIEHPEENAVKIANSNLYLMGSDIVTHLQDAEKCAIMAVTLGIAVDQKIKTLELTNMTKALIMDACATAAVENVCDEVEENISGLAMNMGLRINYRYSPGYGNFSLKVQPNILELLDAQKKIGLNCTDNNILIPRKSVTAVIGMNKDNKRTGSQKNCGACETCNKKQNCLYRKVEVSDEH